MITLLHGDHIVSSRAELTRRIDEAKTQNKEVRRIDGKTVDALALIQAVESSSLFGGTVLVVIERFLTKDSKLIDIIKRSGDATDIILWEDKEIGKTLIGLLGIKASVKLFKIPPAIWELLDGIKPGNSRHLLVSLSHVLERDAAELTFSMIVRRVRQLIQLKDVVTPEGLQGWQAGRLTSQAKSFTMDKLLSMEKQLFDIDVSIKTGASPFPLAQQLELFFVDI